MNESRNRTPLLERAMRTVVQKMPYLSLDESIVAYRKEDEYLQMCVEDKAFLIVELDSMRHADIDAITSAFNRDDSLAEVLRRTRSRHCVAGRRRRLPLEPEHSPSLTRAA